MKKANFDVRAKMLKEGITLTQLSKFMKISLGALSNKLGIELADSEKEKFMKAIEQISREENEYEKV